MGAQEPPGLIGILANMPGAVSSDIDAAAIAGVAPPRGLSQDGERAYEQLLFSYMHGYYAFLYEAHARRSLPDWRVRAQRAYQTDASRGTTNSRRLSRN
jgi:hypothetical protein